MVKFTKVVRAPPGLGKTTLVLAAIARRKGRRVEYYVPTHVLAEEVRGKLQTASPSLRVQVIAGRSHVSANGKPLCKKSKTAEDIARAGGDVYASLCSQKVKGSIQRCPHYNSCPYINQFKSADVTIYTHAYLPLQRMSLESGVPDLAVIDESFFQACIEVIKVPMTLLRAGFLDPLAAQVLAEIEHALVRGVPLFKHLKTVGIDTNSLNSAVQTLRRGLTTISPNVSSGAISASLASLRKRSLLTKLLECVIREEVSGREASHGLRYCADAQMCEVHLKKSIRRFRDHKRNEAQVLIIDGTASEEISKQFFQSVKFVSIPAARCAHVTQVRTTRCSNIALVPGKNKDARSRSAATKRLQEVQGFMNQLARQHGKVLFVGPQDVTGNVKSGINPLLKVPPNVVLAHYGAIRGRDEWKNHDALVLVGRNQPSIDAVEAMARCVFLSDSSPLNFADDWGTEVRGYRLKANKLGVEVVTHPDPRVQLVHEQVRECESQQAIDRLRLIHGDVPKAVYILSNIPLDIDVDELVTWEELMNGSRLRQAWELCGGVLPLGPKWLAATYPMLWTTLDAAKQDVAGVRKKDGFPNISSISKTILFEFQYKKKDQRRWSVCLSRDQDAAWVAERLETLVGEPVDLRPR